MKPVPYEERRVALRDGGELVYVSAGRGLPVLLLNGLGGPRGVWDRLIAQLGDRYRFLAWDYRGLSRSSPHAHSVSDHAADALAILDAEKVARAALVGWSMGVQVAIELFHRAPEQVASLVLINGAARATWAKGGDAPLSGRVIARVLRFLQSAPRATALAIRSGLHSPEAFTWARRAGLISDRVSAEVFARITRSFLELDVAAYLETLRRVGEHDGSDVLRHIDVPTLIVAADRDPFASRAAMEQLVHEISGAEYLALPGVGHFALLDQEERVNLRIEKFWNERGYRADGRTSVAPVPP